jgi:hypothetical protein
MDMRVVIEVLAPGVQNSGEANLRAQMSRIGGDRRKRTRRGLEQSP